MKKETKVKCDVKSCKYNDEKYCGLDELDISCTCDNDKCNCKEETICKSFDKKTKDNNEETEYEYDELEDNEDEYDQDDEELTEEEYIEETIEENELEEKFE